MSRRWSALTPGDLDHDVPATDALRDMLIFGTLMFIAGGMLGAIIW